MERRREKPRKKESWENGEPQVEGGRVRSSNLEEAGKLGPRLSSQERKKKKSSQTTKEPLSSCTHPLSRILSKKTFKFRDLPLLLSPKEYLDPSFHIYSGSATVSHHGNTLIPPRRSSKGAGALMRKGYMESRPRPKGKSVQGLGSINF